jgi:hypothetical protein
VSDLEPGSPEWEWEVCRQDYNAAGQRLRELRRQYDDALSQLVDAAERLGEASAKVRSSK